MPLLKPYNRTVLSPVNVDTKEADLPLILNANFVNSTVLTNENRVGLVQQANNDDHIHASPTESSGPFCATPWGVNYRLLHTDDVIPRINNVSYLGDKDHAYRGVFLAHPITNEILLVSISFDSAGYPILMATKYADSSTDPSGTAVEYTVPITGGPQATGSGSVLDKSISVATEDNQIVFTMTPSLTSTTNVLVFLNGGLLSPTDYVVSDETAIILSSGVGIVPGSTIVALCNTPLESSTQTVIETSLIPSYTVTQSASGNIVYLDTDEVVLPSLATGSHMTLVNTRGLNVLITMGSTVGLFNNNSLMNIPPNSSITISWRTPTAVYLISGNLI